jgi:hypothetical protein
VLKLDEDEYLNLDIFYYDKTPSGEAEFGFTEFSTMQALRHFNKNLKFNKIIIFAEDSNDSEKYLKDKDGKLENIATINDFINLLTTNANYDIIDFEGVLENNIIIKSHDG